MSSKLKKHFEANMLDGDEVQAGQMMSSESVLEYIEEYMTPKPQANTLDEKMDKFLVDITRAKAELHAKPQANTIEEILDTHAEYYIRQTMQFFKNDGISPALSKNNEGDLTAKQAIEALITEAVDRERNRLTQEAYESERTKMSEYIDEISHPTLRIVMDTGKYLEVQQIKDVVYGGDVIQVTLQQLKEKL